MAETADNYVERTANRLLRFLRCCSGSSPLHNIQFSPTIIQYLLDNKLLQIQNTGREFLLQIAEEI